jgi:hypothetical protein
MGYSYTIGNVGDRYCTVDLPERKTNKTWLFFSEIYGGTLAYAKSVLADRRGLGYLLLALKTAGMI